MPLFSIITVCKNEEKKIGRTIRSVLDQDFKDYEYIVVDGKSTDRTYMIAERFGLLFSKKNIKCSCYSESDSGIYDAMNKGADYAKGKWILYLNAGDILYDSSVLSKAAEKLDREGDVAYGNTVISYPYPLYSLIEPLPIDEIINQMIFCHQSCFVKASLLKEDKFETRLKVAADYDFLLKQYLKDASFQYLDMTVSEYDGEGESSRDEYTMRKEMNAAWYRNHLIDRKTYIHNRDMNRMFYMDGRNIRKLKKLLPAGFLKLIHYVHWYIRLKREGYTKERP